MRFKIGDKLKFKTPYGYEGPAEVIKIENGKYLLLYFKINRVYKWSISYIDKAGVLDV